MRVEIDKYAGFCFGVTNAIREAEKYVSEGIYCLGEIVHNAKEEERLIKLGMKTAGHQDLTNLAGKKLLIRAHGEPPETYLKALDSGIDIIDATCPVVLRLQKRIKEKFEESDGHQVVIYGKKGHAEVNGLVGQTGGKAIVISNMAEAESLDISKPTFLFSQTTSNYSEYEKIAEYLKKKSAEVNGKDDLFTVYQTICPSVKNRIPRLREFCSEHDAIIFVSDYNSSNGKMLFGVCTEANINSHFITGVEDLKPEWIISCSSVGISGATSTPLWLMEKVKDGVNNLLTK